MKKRLFQILDEMNQADEASGGKMVQVCPSLVSANLAKGGVHITMGIPGGVGEILALENSKLIPVLLLVDADEYEKRKVEKCTCTNSLQAENCDKNCDHGNDPEPNS